MCLFASMYGVVEHSYKIHNHNLTLSLHVSMIHLRMFDLLLTALKRLLRMHDHITLLVDSHGQYLLRLLKFLTTISELLQCSMYN